MDEQTRRVPCESAVCDSSTNYCDSTTAMDFPSERVSTQSTNRSHLPTEHAENSTTAIKTEPVSLTAAQTASTVTNFSTAELDSQIQGASLTSGEKAPDSTFIPDQVRVQGGPPPYSPLSTNNTLNYRTATPHYVTPQQSSMDLLAPYLSLPVSILGQRTRRELALILNPEVVMGSNWKVMAECMDFSNREINNFELLSNPTDAVIQAWAHSMTDSGLPPTIGDLLNILNRDLNRADVVTDIPPLILKDVQRHLKNVRRENTEPMMVDSMYLRMNSTPASLPPMHSAMPPFFHSYSSPMQMSCAFGLAPNMLSSTYEEKAQGTNSSRPVQVQEVQPSEPEQLYDAFVLCNIADKRFVMDRFLPKVEKEGNLKLCLADRDMPAGNLAFVQLMNYMFQRSKKLVVILSDEFFTSQEHDWQSNLAISQDPASRTQRIIPVKYKKITKRNIFDHLGCCDYTRTMEESWFWDKIIKGIKAP